MGKTHWWAETTLPQSSASYSSAAHTLKDAMCLSIIPIVSTVSDGAVVSSCSSVVNWANVTWCCKCMASSTIAIST